MSKTLERIAKILNYLYSVDEWTWIRDIARNTGLKPGSVSYLIDKYLKRYVEIVDSSQVLGQFGIKIKLIRLKNKEIPIEEVLRRISVKLTLYNKKS